MQLNAISPLKWYFGKKRTGSTLNQQLYLFKFKKIFSCVAIQHLQNREKRT